MKMDGGCVHVPEWPGHSAGAGNMVEGDVHAWFGQDWGRVWAELIVVWR